MQGFDNSYNRMDDRLRRLLIEKILENTKTYQHTAHRILVA